MLTKNKVYCAVTVLNLLCVVIICFFISGRDELVVIRGITKGVAEGKISKDIIKPKTVSKPVFTYETKAFKKNFQGRVLTTLGNEGIFYENGSDFTVVVEIVSHKDREDEKVVGTYEVKPHSLIDVLDLYPEFDNYNSHLFIYSYDENKGLELIDLCLWCLGEY